jgi:Uma2 family endonuclease
MDAARKRMTVAEFLAWVETQPRGKYELWHGEVFAMGSDRAQHGRAKFATGKAFERAIDKAGTTCEAFVDCLQVQISETTSFEPDALVNCGERLPGEAVFATNPVVIVEVLSPSTERADKTRKVPNYLSLPVVRHVLLIDTIERRVQHFRRGDDGVITFAFSSTGQIALDPPGLTVDVEELLG